MDPKFLGINPIAASNRAYDLAITISPPPLNSLREQPKIKIILLLFLMFVTIFHFKGTAARIGRPLLGHLEDNTTLA